MVLDSYCTAVLLCWIVIVLQRCGVGQLLYCSVVVLDSYCTAVLWCWTFIVLQCFGVGQLLYCGVEVFISPRQGSFIDALSEERVDRCYQ